MYILELMALKVDGVKVYLSDPWNYMDQITLPIYAYYFSMMSQNPDAKIIKLTGSLYEAQKF